MILLKEEKGRKYMKCNLTCIITRAMNKDNKEYYTLEIQEIGTRTFLSPTEVKLFKLLVEKGDIKIIEE